jgi:hypothetical protein
MFQSIYIRIFKSRISKVRRQRIQKKVSTYIYFRAFKSILKCQRIKQYKPSTNLHRVTSPMNNQSRAKRSISCEMSGSHSIRKSESTISHRTSNDSQRHVGSLRTNRNIVNNLHRTESITNTTIRKSLSTPDNTSPWHLRKPMNVR